jgi:hypothetical protein
MNLQQLIKRRAVLDREMEQLSNSLLVKAAEIRRLDDDIATARSVEEHHENKRTIMGYLKRAMGREEVPMLPAPPEDEE